MVVTVNVIGNTCFILNFKMRLLFNLRALIFKVNVFYSIANINPKDSSISISGGFLGEAINILNEALTFT